MWGFGSRRRRARAGKLPTTATLRRANGEVVELRVVEGAFPNTHAFVTSDGEPVQIEWGDHLAVDSVRPGHGLEVRLRVDPNS